MFAPATVNPASFHPGYYMMVGSRDGNDAFDKIKGNSDFVGVKKLYFWDSIETAENVYDFSPIENDLNYLQSIGKRLWLEITITQWNPNLSPAVPGYIQRDTKYGGDNAPYGAFQLKPGISAWRTIIWNPNVQNKLIALYTALGKRFNNEPYFEGINIGETSMEQGPGWSSANVDNAFKAMSLGAKKAFPDKVVFLQPNFGPPDPSTMRQWLAENKIGFGNPDTVLSGSGFINAFPDYIKYHDVIPTGPDVQWDNYERCCNSSGANYTSAELLEASVKGTNPWYMFWEKREPYFTNEVLPAIKAYGPLPAAREFYNSSK